MFWYLLCLAHGLQFTFSLAEVGSSLYMFGSLTSTVCDNVLRVDGQVINVSGEKPPQLCGATLIQISSDSIALIGGRSQTGVYNDEIFIFRFADYTWIRAINLDPGVKPASRENALACTNGTVILTGGVGAHGLLNDLWDVDFVADRGNIQYSSVYYKWTQLLGKIQNSGRRPLLLTCNQDVYIYEQCGRTHVNIAQYPFAHWEEAYDCLPNNAHMIDTPSGIFAAEGCEDAAERCSGSLFLFKNKGFEPIARHSAQYRYFRLGLRSTSLMLIGFPLGSNSVSEVILANATPREACKGSFVGPRCAEQGINFVQTAECSSNGFVSFDGICTCYPGFFGPLCRFGDATAETSRSTLAVTTHTPNVEAHTDIIDLPYQIRVDESIIRTRNTASDQLGYDALGPQIAAVRDDVAIANSLAEDLAAAQTARENHMLSLEAAGDDIDFIAGNSARPVVGLFGYVGDASLIIFGSSLIFYWFIDLHRRSSTQGDVV